MSSDQTTIWQQIDTMPPSVLGAWLGYTPTQSMVCAYRFSEREPWNVMWQAGVKVRWAPTHWQPLPCPPGAPDDQS